MTDKLEAMSAAKLSIWVMEHLLTKMPDKVGPDESGEALEICSRLRERDAAINKANRGIKRAETISVDVIVRAKYQIRKDCKNILSAMLAAREGGKNELDS